MRFSIIVPVYRVEQYIDQCVQSVLAQNFSDYELILVDDGSPDRCPKMCDGYAAEYPQIQVVHKANGGLSSARNEGMVKATGDYILFLDSDDWWDDSDALAGLDKTIEDTHADVVVFRMKKYYQKENQFSCANSIVNKARLADVDYLMEQNLFIASACDKAIRRECIWKYNLSFRVGQLSEDIEWCCKILLSGMSVAFYNHAFYVYRQNSASISHNVSRRNLEDIAKVIQNCERIFMSEGNRSLAVMHFLAQQFVLWMGNSTLVTHEDISDLHSKMKKYWYLLKYDRYPYVKKVKKCMFLGYSPVRFLLGIYMNKRRQ